MICYVYSVDFVYCKSYLLIDVLDWMGKLDLIEW